MSKKWLRERRQDPWYKKAKKEGWRTRASYKLLQLDERFELFHEGDRVVDLGAAPGGWAQVAAEIVGETGSVVGVDLDAIEPFAEGEVTAATPVTFLRGDMTKADTVAKVLQAVDGVADVVISDMSPNISGTYSIDHARSVYLCEMALSFAEKVLRRGGSFVCKMFEGEDTKVFLDKARKRFTEVKVTSPAASRDASSEVYVVARGFTGMVMPPLEEKTWKEGESVTDAPIRRRKRDARAADDA